MTGYTRQLWPFGFWNSQNEEIRVLINDKWIKYVSNRINFGVVSFMQRENIEG